MTACSSTITPGPAEREMHARPQSDVLPALGPIAIPVPQKTRRPRKSELGMIADQQGLARDAAAANSPAITAPALEIAAPAEDIFRPPRTPGRAAKPIRCWPRPQSRHFPSPCSAGFHSLGNLLQRALHGFSLYSRLAIADQRDDESAGPTALLPARASAYNYSMEKKIFWMVFTVLGLVADFLLPIWWGWPRPFQSSSCPGGWPTAAIGSELQELQDDWDMVKNVPPSSVHPVPPVRRPSAGDRGAAQRIGSIRPAPVLSRRSVHVSVEG